MESNVAIGIVDLPSEYIKIKDKFGWYRFILNKLC